MYKYILESAGDINWMALFALLTFVTVFGTSVLMIMRKDNKTLHHVASLPLDDGELVENHSKQ